MTLSRATKILVRAAILILFPLSGCQCSDPVSNNEDPACIDCDGPCAADPCGEDRLCETAGETYVCRCAPGLVEVGGECTDDPCAGDACGDRANSECVAVQGQPSCECLPGHTEDVDGNCVVETSCSEETCQMRGICTESADGPECACDPGYSGRFCESCDAEAGYVDDGQGGCTMDPCEVLNCAIDQECVVANDGTALCACQPGFHDEGGQCVEDTTCGANSCNGAGQCDDAGGRVACDCDEGFTGQFCGACDQAGGYHDDGMGGCTMDECLPNPCTDPNKTVCTSGGPQQYECACDSGYHDEGGACEPDETCQADSCNGNGTCDDSTNVIVCACDPGYIGTFCDQCDANAGYRPDGSGGCTTAPCTPNALPDDGFDCTIDTCPNNLAVHTPDDSACDDGLWCSGVEVCAPADPNADARGCVSDPPVPPASPSPCQYYGACDEQTQSFPLLDRSAGDSCSDGIYCSTGDSCDASGNCVGTLQPDCPSDAGCTSTSPLTSYDVVEAHINPTVTYNGQDPVAADLTTAFQVWAVERETGTWNAIANYYGLSLSGAPSMRYSDRLLPGIYDLVYTNTTSNSDYERYWLTESDDDALFGLKTLQTDVVIGAGTTDLVIDIPAANISPTVTYDGQDPVAADLTTAFQVWAVNRETGTWNAIANYYGLSLSGAPSMRYSDRLPPGTYDLVYTNTTSNSDYERYWLTESDDDALFGLKTLQTDVVISDSGANPLTIDIPAASISPTVTYDGQNPVAADLTTAFQVWAVNRETGTWNAIANYYGLSLSGAPSMRYSDRLPPGTYDLVYTNTTSNSDYERYWLTESDDDAVFGLKTLQTDVVISDSGANPLTIDIPAASISPTVTYDGQDPVAADLTTAFQVWAVNRDNGTWNAIANYYGLSLSGAPSMRYSDRLPPGTYDLVYTNTTSNSDYERYWLTESDDDAVFGLKTLQTDVVITDSGANALSIDIPAANIAPTVTYDGQDPVAADLTAAFQVWAVNRATGTRNAIASYYGLSLSGAPSMRYSDRLPPGTYDIVYTNTTSNSDYERYWLTELDDDAVFGLKTLQTDVVISDVGANALSIDIPSSNIAPTVTYDGQDPVAADLTAAFQVWAVSRQSGTWNALASYYGLSFSGAPSMRYSDRLLPGTYDLVYTNTTSNSDYERYWLTESGDDAVFGRYLLQQCVAVP